MSKQVSAADLAAIVTKLLTDPDGAGNLSGYETFQGFMTEIATVVTNYCGGEIRCPADSVDNIFLIGIHGNDSLPPDGGIWADVDPEGELFPKAEDVEEVAKNEMAIALGFASKEQMQLHQDWLMQNKARHIQAVAYQGSAEARNRADTASKEFGIPVETIIFVEPPAGNGHIYERSQIMANQGVVSILDCDGSMFFKVVAGSYGFNAAKLVEWALAHQGAMQIEDVYKAALNVQFGSACDLVVQQSDGSFAYDGDEIDGIGGLYLDDAKFLDPRFNPRWETGTADYVEVVTLKPL